MFVNKKAIYYLAVPLFFKAVSVFAESLPTVATSPPETIVSREGMRGLVYVINQARNSIYGIIILIGVLFILFSAFTIMTSGGDDKKLQRGKTMLKNTIIGIIIAILAVSIILVTLSIFDYGSSSVPDNSSSEEEIDNNSLPSITDDFVNT